MAAEDGPTPALLRIALSGGHPELRIEDGPEVAPRSRRAAALLAVLALAPAHAVSRDRLADLLWGQRGPEQARASLRQCLLELRGLGTPFRWLVSDRGRVMLSAGRVRVDILDTVLQVEKAEGAKPAAAALRSMNLERMLADLNAGPDIDQWVLEARASIERTLFRAVSDRIAGFAAVADHQGARLLADAYLETCPDNEDMTVRAMTADMALGEHSTALRRFEKLRSVLVRELGCAPGAAATRLRGEAIAGQAPSQAFPTDLELSIGRAAPRAAPHDGPPLVLVPTFGVQPGSAASSLAVALREEILAGLARFREVRLSSRADPVSRDTMSATEAARAYALIVTLHGEDGDARLVARVMRVGGDEVVWAETFDIGRLGSAVGVAAIVKRVIATVLPAVTENFFRQLEGRADGPYDEYLLARHRSIHCWRYEDIAAAAAELERIIGERPDFAPAYAPLARLLNTDYFYSALGTSGPAERRRALELARTAVTLDAQDAHNHAVLGFCHLWHGQPSLARKRFDRVLELNPYNVVRLYEVATGLVYIGALAEARDILERTSALGVGHSDAYHEDMARLMVARRDYAGALGELDLVTRPNIKTELYAAMAASLSGRADAGEEIAAWRRDVVARWRGGQPPDTAAIVAWIANHHPFEPELKATFMSDVAAMIGQSPPD